LTLFFRGFKIIIILLFSPSPFSRVQFLCVFLEASVS
jgi:hypothetical protein